MYNIFSATLFPARLFSLLTNYIPDYCLQNRGEDALEQWQQLITQAYKKVRGRERERGAIPDRTFKLTSVTNPALSM